MSGNCSDKGTDVDDSGDDIGEDEMAEETTPIESVWDHPLIQKKKVDGKKFWKCLAIGCGREFADWNNTKAMAHGAIARQCK